jgi:hypothetical protein
MIIDDPNSHFIFIFHPNIYSGEKYTVYNGREMTNAQVMEHWGKWLVLAPRERLDGLAQKLDRFVEARLIPCIKYDRNPSKNLGMEECVMMVYCDFRKRDQVWALLKKQGVRLKAWVTEKETMELWMPGSPLLERWMESMNFDAATKELVREDAGRRLKHILENPDEIFSPWEQ